MNEPKLELTLKLNLLDEARYTENVDYYMRVLSLLTEKEVENIHECWNYINITQDFLMTVFLRMFSVNSMLMQPFKRLTDNRQTTLKDNKVLRKHNENIRQTLNTIVKDIKNPNSWMLEILRIATLHMIYGVGTEHFKSFKRFILENLKESLAEDLTPQKEEICDRVFECVISFMNQFKDDEPIVG